MADLKTLITPLSRNLGTDGLIEARFGSMSKDRFFNGISRQTWNRILSTFQVRVTPTIINQTDYIAGSIRRSVDNGVTWLDKKQVWYQDLPNYGLRVTINRENEISEVPNFTPQLIRHKQSFIFPLGNGIADLILIHSAIDTDRKGADDRFEVEVKLNHSTQIVPFLTILNGVIQQIFNTADPYTLPERIAVFQELNRIFQVPTPRHDGIHGSVLVQARNLKIKDVVSNGLLSGIGYSVSHKIDGQRRLLAILDSGIWMVTEHGEANRLTRKTIPTLTGTVIDGEFIPKDRRKPGAPTQPYWMIFFDTVAYGGTTEIQNQPHYGRMLVAQQVVDLMNTMELSHVAVNTNKFVALDTEVDLVNAPEFFNIMQRMSEEVSTLTYETDGFMFRPERSPYNSHSNEKPLPERILTRYPDICKWKPPNLNTIDFSLQWKMESGVRSLDLMSWDGRQLVSFTKPFIVAAEDPLIVNLPTGTIVEFEFRDGTTFYPIRVRFDKIRPNKLEIAIDNYELIQNPLTLETLQGKTFDLVRAYHQREIDRHQVSEIQRPGMKIQGKGLFYAMDSRLVQQLLQPEINGPMFESLTLGTKNLKMKGDHLEVVEHNTVEKWYPVETTEPIHRLESEPFLSPPERIWSRLFVIGTWSPPKSVSPLVVLSAQPGQLAPGDDSMESFRFRSIDEPIVRLGTLPGVLHAILKAYYVEYQNNPSADYRIHLVDNLRKDIESAYQRTFTDAELLPAIPSLLGVDVIVINGLNVIEYNQPPENRGKIILLYIDGHYEVIGADRSTGIQTVFSAEDLFIFALKPLKVS